MILGLCVGFWMSTIKVVQVATDFFEKDPERKGRQVCQGEVDATLDDQKKKKEDEAKKKEEELKTDKKTLKKETDQEGRGWKVRRRRRPARARHAEGRSWNHFRKDHRQGGCQRPTFSEKGGFATALRNPSGYWRTQGRRLRRRRKKRRCRYRFRGRLWKRIGGGSGFSGVDDLIGGLPGRRRRSSLSLKKRGNLTVSEPKFVKGGALTGGRSRASIMRVVMQNIAALRYAYNKTPAREARPQRQDHLQICN